MTFDDVNRLTRMVYEPDMGEHIQKMLSTVHWKVPADYQPVYGPTRWDYAQIILEEFRVAFVQLLSEHPEISILGTEDGPYATHKNYGTLDIGRIEDGW